MPNTGRKNPYVCLAIVVILGTVAVIGTAGLVAGSLLDRPAPPALVSVVSVAMGSLGSFLVVLPLGSNGTGHRPPNEEGRP